MDDVVTRKEFDEYVKRMDLEHKVLHDSYTKIEAQLKEVHNISLSVEKLALNMEHMVDELKKQQENQDKHDERLENLEARDGEMWRKLIGYVLTCIAGIIVGYIFMKIGM